MANQKVSFESPITKPVTHKTPASESDCCQEFLVPLKLTTTLNMIIYYTSCQLQILFALAAIALISTICVNAQNDDYEGNQGNDGYGGFSGGSEDDDYAAPRERGIVGAEGSDINPGYHQGDEAGNENYDSDDVAAAASHARPSISRPNLMKIIKQSTR